MALSCLEDWALEPAVPPELAQRRVLVAPGRERQALARPQQALWAQELGLALV
jgi:hypothetical protein